ncbi:MAG: cellulose biosynthesis cyclic di-GMP-binding regulatory protein BcsB [Bacillota bacterium]|nr:cellulose biosynthesis cyclic di-GMP-binding regulatory protein BcsB [Bacillota bacterium]
MTTEKITHSIVWTAGWLAVIAVIGNGLLANAEPAARKWGSQAALLDPTERTVPEASVPESLEAKNWRTISIVKSGQEAPELSSSGSEIRTFFRLRVDRMVTAARLRLSSIDKKGGAVGIEVVLNGYTAGQIELTAGQVEVLALDPALLSDDNVLVLRRSGADTCEPAADDKLLLALKTAELELQQAALPIANDVALLPLPFLDPRVEEPTTIQIALLGERTLEMVQAAGLVAAYFGLQGGSQLRFAVFFDELPVGDAVVLAAGESELTRGLIAGKSPTVRLVDNPNGTNDAAKLLVIAAATPGELLTVAQRFAEGNIARGGVLPGNRSEYQPYEAPRWVKSNKAICLGDLTAGADLVLEGASRVTQAVSFRLAPDLFAELNRVIPLVIDYRVSVPSGAPSPELVVELNHRFIGKLAVPEPAQRSMLQHARFAIHPSQLSGYNELRLHANFSPNRRGCEQSGPVLSRVVIEGSTVLHIEQLHHFAVMPDVKLFVYDGFPFTRFADLRETAVLLAPQPRPAELGLLFSALAHVSAITGELPKGAVFANSSSTYKKAGRDRDLLVVADGPGHPWLQSHADELPFAYTSSGLAPRCPWRPGVLLNYLTGFAAFVQLHQARRFAQTVSSVLGVASVESPWTPDRSTVLLLATENSQVPALADAMGNAEASLAGGDLLLAGTDRRGAFVLGPRTTRGALPLWSKGRWFFAAHWLLLVPMLIFPALFLVRWSARALELQAQRRLQLPRRRQL